jgi:ribosomal protein S18 acetylase RimI-like enzyme
MKDALQDIKLKDGRAVYYFRFLPWDTQFFNQKSYFLDVSKSLMMPSNKIRKKFKNRLRNSFVTAKVDTSCGSKTLGFLNSLGFKYIDTEVILRYVKLENHRRQACILKNNDKSPLSIKIIEAKNTYGLSYAELGSSFRYTRFHQDERIPKKQADLLWINYIRNYRVSAKRHLFIAKVKNKTVGAVAVEEDKKNKRLLLTFVAVIEGYRGKKIGSALLRPIFEKFQNHDIFVETQLKNKGALRFYKKNGFSILEEVKTILHRWG